MSTDELGQSLGISKTSTLRILRKGEIREGASRLVPYMLTTAQKELRVTISMEHLNRCQSDPDFLDRLIAIDKLGLKV